MGLRTREKLGRKGHPDLDQSRPATRWRPELEPDRLAHRLGRHRVTVRWMVYSGGSMKRTQRGVTMIGWIVLLIPVAIVGYTGIRLVPVYLNYAKISRAMTQLTQELRNSDTQQSIFFALDKRLDIEQVEFPNVK